MHTRALLTALLVLPFVAAGTRAQDYTIKLKEHPDKGKSTTVTNSEATRISFAVSLDGKVLKEDKKVEVDEKQYTEKVLEGGTPHPTKFTRTYTKARKGDKDNPLKLPFEGKLVLFELKDGKYQASADGVAQNDLKELAKAIRKDDSLNMMMPKKAVKVGDTWTVGKEAIALLLGPDSSEGVDLVNAKCQGKLTKTYKKESQDWGTLDINLDVPVKKFGPLPLAKPIDLHFKLTLDTAIDGSSTAGQMKGTMTLKGKSDFAQNGQKFGVDLSINGDFAGVSTAEK